MSLSRQLFRKFNILKQQNHANRSIAIQKDLHNYSRLHSHTVLFSSCSQKNQVVSDSKSVDSKQTIVSSQLSACLSKELSEEKVEYKGPPAFLLNYFKNLEFKLNQEDGNSVVELRRWFGKELIVVRFSIQDVSRGFLDEDSPEISMIEPDNPPIKCHIVIQKPQVGSLLFDCQVFDGDFGIHHITLYPRHFGAQPSEASEVPKLKRQAFRCPFEDHDEDLKVAIENYLEARGIDAKLASFVRSFSLFKDQNEYMNWLNSMNSFVKA